MAPTNSAPKPKMGATVRMAKTRMRIMTTISIRLYVVVVRLPSIVEKLDVNLKVGRSQHEKIPRSWGDEDERTWR